eukprot:8377793-Pyramimonas_sp.AAC.1
MRAAACRRVSRVLAAHVLSAGEERKRGGGGEEGEEEEMRVRRGREENQNPTKHVGNNLRKLKPRDTDAPTPPREPPPGVGVASKK